MNNLIDELPEGWISSPLITLLLKLESGSRPKGGVRGISKGVPSIGGEHLNSSGGFNFDNIKYVPLEFYRNMHRAHIQIDDILIVKDGATTGKTSLVTKYFPHNPAVVNEHVFICRPYNEIYSPFLFYYLYSKEGNTRIMENFRGSAQGGINQSFADNAIVSIAPLAEQKRIVAKVEELLAHVKAARERLLRAQKLLKRFRQAVLNAAVTGRLTEEWRKKQDDQDWDEKEFFDFCVLQRGYDLPIAQRIDGPYPIVTSGGIAAYHNQYKMKGPGVLIGRSGSTGKAHYVESNFWPHNTNLYVKDFKGNVPKYVYFFLLNFDFQSISASTAVPTLNRNNLRGIIVSVPPPKEQREIVRRVEDLYALADKIEKRVLLALTRTEKLTQSILAKAFRGELVLTEAELARQESREYEPASVLLERIKKEREKDGSKSKKITRRKRNG